MASDEQITPTANNPTREDEDTNSRNRSKPAEQKADQQKPTHNLDPNSPPTAPKSRYSNLDTASAKATLASHYSQAKSAELANNDELETGSAQDGLRDHGGNKQTSRPYSKNFKIDAASAKAISKGRENNTTLSQSVDDTLQNQPCVETEQEPTGMNRDVISGGEVQRLVRMRDGDHATILDDAALLASRRQFIPDSGLSDDLLVFGYGSLIWNPCMKVKDRIPARLFGFHRRFCLKSTIGRGSPEAPGLVLALDYGGSVSGVCFKIDKKDLVREADLLWRREMLNGSYAPRWVKVRTQSGTQRALTFVIDRQKPAFTPRMSPEETADIIARASGFVGSNADYLVSTQNALLSSGIDDPLMRRLVQLVLEA